jgi:pyroglutamyl-peptidase
MKLLLTGFEPFGGSQVNPSQMAVEALAETGLPGVELAPVILPVDGAAAPKALIAAIEAEGPDAVVCLGQAPCSGITIERVAVNLLDYPIPDNTGAKVVDQPVVPGGPDAYFTALPVREMLAAAKAAGVPAELSLSAGAYLCNQVMYTLLHYRAQQGLEIPAGFIHVPPLPQQAAEANKPTGSMGLGVLVRGLQAALGVLTTN